MATMVDGWARGIKAGNCLLVLALAGAPLYLRASAQAPALPEIPPLNMAAFPPETRKQVQQAYEAARASPRDADAVGKLGMLFSLYKRPDDAVACFKRAHELAPRSFQWLYFWGYLMFVDKKYKAAEAALTSALQLRPEYIAARLKLAESLLGSGKVEEAGRLYDGILKEYPDSAEACYGLGRVHAARGDQASAVEFYRQACELFPTYGAAHYALARAYRQLGQSDKAQEQLSLYERNKNIVPPVDDPLRDELRDLDMSAVSYLERGVFLEQVGRIQDAIKATERAVELDPKLVQAHINLLSLYGRVGNLPKAEEQYRAVMALNPEQFPKAHYDYGVLLLRKGKYKEAEEAFRHALRIDPSYTQARNNLGYMLERQGKIAEAEAEYRQALESDPNFRQAHFNLGRILVSQGKYKEGIQQLSQTLTPEDENTPAYLYALGAAYGRAGDRQNALRYLHQAREQASARGQAKLLADIDGDLRTLEAQTPKQ